MSEQKSKDLDLKKPDAFQVKVTEIFSGIVENPKPLLAVIAVIFLALAGGYAIRYFVASKQEQRQDELSKIDQAFESEGKAHTKEREALEKQRDTLKAAQQSLATTGKDAKPIEDSSQIKALDAQIKALKPDHSASALQFKSYYTSHAKSAEGLVAGLRYAAFNAEQNQLEEAQKLLEELVENSKGNMILQVQGLFLLISVLEDRNEFDKALIHIETLLKSTSPEIKARALLSKSQLYFFKKDFVNARGTANQLLADHETSTEADRARSLLALLPE